MENSDCYKIVNFNEGNIKKFNDIFITYYNIFYDDFGEKRLYVIDQYEIDGMNIIKQDNDMYFIKDNDDIIEINSEYIEIIKKYFGDVFKIFSDNNFNGDTSQIKQFIYNIPEFIQIIKLELDYIIINKYNTMNLLVVRGGGDRLDQNIPKFARNKDFFIILIESCSGWGCPDDKLCTIFSEEGKTNKILHLKGELDFSNIMTWDIFNFFNNPSKKHVIIDTISYGNGIRYYVDFKNIGNKFYEEQTHFFYSTGPGIYFYNKYDIRENNNGDVIHYITELHYNDKGKCDHNEKSECPLNSINYNELGSEELLNKFIPVKRYKLNGGNYDEYLIKYIKYKNKYMKYKNKYMKLKKNIL